MIPYDELVVALQTWRARQGLPVTQMSGSMTPPPPAPTTRSAPPPMVQSKPPAPPPPKAAVVAAPPPLERPSTDSLLDVEDAALLDDGHYENEGDNFTMKFGAHEVEQDSESTNVATDIEARLTDPNLANHEETIELPDPKHSIRSGNRNDDW